MMRFLPSFAAVGLMSAGVDPTEACRRSLAPISRYFPAFSGGIVCLHKDGRHGAASYNMGFSYSFVSAETNGTVVSIPVQ